MTQARSIRNWGKTFTYTPKSLIYPTHKDEIISLVGRCNQQQRQVRPVGSRYSYTPLICSEEVALSLDEFSGVEEINPDELTVTVRAGTKISLLEQELFSRGYSLYNLGEYQPANSSRTYCYRFSWYWKSVWYCINASGLDRAGYGRWKNSRMFSYLTS